MYIGTFGNIQCIKENNFKHKLEHRLKTGEHSSKKSTIMVDNRGNVSDILIWGNLNIWFAPSPISILFVLIFKNKTHCCT